MFNPTPQQIDILNCDTHCVVVAGPGSGKTTTLAHKINQVLKDLRWYQGVIAISYTNKASNELKRKSEQLSDDVKNSSFSTIDSFCISNILIPFGKHFFGLPIQKVTVDKSRFDIETAQEIKYFLETLVLKYAEVSIDELVSKNIEPIAEIRKRDLELISRHFQEGNFDLRLIGHISYLIYISSKSCRDYFKSRFKYVFIDEFQDSGLEQYLLFIRLAETGIISWAIGDVNQSIFGFAEKSSDYLFRLMENPNFVKLPMNINHRCHKSIDFYSKKLLNFDVDYSGESRVFEVHESGNETSIGRWLTTDLNIIKEAFGVTHNCEIGVLAKTERTLELFSQQLEAPFKLHLKSPIDNDQTLWGALFRELLHFSLGNISIYEFIDNCFDRELPQLQITVLNVKQFLLKLKAKVVRFRNAETALLDDICDLFIKVSLLVYPESKNDESIKYVREIFEQEQLLNTFSPSDKNQIQLMTLHKSKGLEFDVVIHLDLYQYIIPGYDWVVKGIKKEFHESRNLHYVGVTRARKALFLATSDNRFIAKKKNFDTAQPSEFLFDSGIEAYRLEWNEFKLSGKKT
ncbi:UvrD-helicase domain-containing protein [Paenibacillus sp. GCM10023248]|uniref:UvrD-helicase domain-containing protein n=1 Tax=unclassified Paenibacillus TaxID=185978 RepID=UPI002378DCA4|nr:ATP-dependent helicase [Paenibacillus sp. MAHUQ-63]MDD9267865.1 ATP-dependent helicase [Paenibacillus sp. MAHUQ-63]